MTMPPMLKTVPRENDLGYVPALRLACLRRDHVDPVDLETHGFVSGLNLDLSLSEFDDQHTLGAVEKDWNGIRYAANRELMQHLLVNMQETAGRPLPFLVKQRHLFSQADWYGLWDDPRAPLPELSEKLAMDGSDANANYAAFAHTQSHTVVYELSQWNVQSKESLVSSLQQMKPGWDGIVLDFSADPSGNPLAGLADSMTPLLPKSQDDSNPEK